MSVCVSFQSCGGKVEVVCLRSILRPVSRQLRSCGSPAPPSAESARMAECGEPRHLDLFITIILNCSYYLGLTILTIMCLIGIYFVFTHCCWKPYSKRYLNKTHFFVCCITIFSFRRQKRFLGISSRPSFVATIQFAFYNNLSTFQEIVVNRPGITLLIIYNRWLMFL